jgi:hypothetical protein
MAAGTEKANAELRIKFQQQVDGPRGGHFLKEDSEIVPVAFSLPA